MVSKSRFKARALEFFRQVERTGQALVVTDRGRPVVRIVPWREDPEDAREALRGTLISYEDPTAPVGEEDWEALR